MPGSTTKCLTKLATLAAQWGADQRGAVNEAELQKARDEELKACCLLLDDGEHAASYGCHNGSSLRAARRPKPLSLKEEALTLLDQHEEGWRPSPKDWDTIRTAIEALPND